MKLILVRHAPAGDPGPKYPDDRARPLTKTGIQKFKKAAAGLGKIVKPDAVLCSPFARTMQTADLLNWDGNWPMAVADDSLEDGRDPSEVIDAIKKLPGKPATVGIVGHGPALGMLSQYLLGTGDGETPVHFNKGAAAMIELPKRSMKPGTGTLTWSMRRKELKQHR